MANEGSLWMGDIEDYMDELFLMRAFGLMGVYDIRSVKIIKNRYTGKPIGYGFINFSDDEAALSVMQKVNGKIIPNSRPPVKFRLHHSSATERNASEAEHSLWVGELTAEVDDTLLYKTFATRYQSLRTAKVMVDQNGASRGYGFLRFSDPADHRDCLKQMNGFRGLGGKPIKVSLAMMKKNTTGTTVSSTPSTTTQSQYSQYYGNYWGDTSGWGAYGAYSTSLYGTGGATGAYDAGSSYGPHLPETPSAKGDISLDDILDSGVYEDSTLIDHTCPIDVDAMNQKMIERSEEFWDALDESRWLPIENTWDAAFK